MPWELGQRSRQIDPEETQTSKSFVTAKIRRRYPGGTFLSARLLLPSMISVKFANSRLPVEVPGLNFHLHLSWPTL